MHGPGRYESSVARAIQGLGLCSVHYACSISRGVEKRARWRSELRKEGVVETET